MSKTKRPRDVIEVIKRRYPNDKLVKRFTSAIDDIIYGLTNSEDFCPYACPTITALQLTLRMLEGDATVYWEMVKRLDDLRSEILELREDRADVMFLKHGLFEYEDTDPEPGSKHDMLMRAASTGGLRGYEEFGGFVWAADTCVRILPGLDLTFRHKAAQNLIKLLEREEKINKGGAYQPYGDWEKHEALEVYTVGTK
jgi:hypothetical protein